jgi:hypothetical protein
MAMLFTMLRVLAYLGHKFTSWRANAALNRHDKYDSKYTAICTAAEQIAGNDAQHPMVRHVKVKKLTDEGEAASEKAIAAENRWQKWAHYATCLATLREGLSNFGGRRVPYAAGAFDLALVLVVGCYLAGIDVMPVLNALAATVSRLPLLG